MFSCCKTKKSTHVRDDNDYVGYRICSALLFLCVSNIFPFCDIIHTLQTFQVKSRQEQQLKVRLSVMYTKFPILLFFR